MTPHHSNGEHPVSARLELPDAWVEALASRGLMFWPIASVPYLAAEEEARYTRQPRVDRAGEKAARGSPRLRPRVAHDPAGRAASSTLPRELDLAKHWTEEDLPARGGRR